MKWLTIDYIKQHARLDFSDEDSVLELYADSSEEAVLNVLNRTYQDIIEQYGEVPASIRHATLLLVAKAYKDRESDLVQQVYDNKTLTFLLKPYARLTDAPKSGQPVQTYTIGSQFKILIAASLPDGLKMIDVNFTVTVYNDDQKDQQKVYTKTECILTDDGDYVVLVDSEALGVGTYMVKVVFEIPDTDYPSGYRKEVIRINPNIKVTG